MRKMWFEPSGGIPESDAGNDRAVQKVGATVENSQTGERRHIYWRVKCFLTPGMYSVFLYFAPDTSVNFNLNLFETGRFFMF